MTTNELCESPDCVGIPNICGDCERKRIYAAERVERKRIVALAYKWSEDYEGGAEGAGMPDFDIFLMQAKALRLFAEELEGKR